MLDIIIVFAYLITLLVIGVSQRSGNKGFKSFYAISNKLRNNRIILVATIFVSSIGGGTIFGIAEKTVSENIAHSYGLLLVIPIDILIAIYIIPRLIKHHKSETVGDIMHVYYGKIGRYISGFSAILVSVGFIAAQISVSGHIFEYILQINYIYGVVFSYGIIVIYTSIGGFKSVLLANQIQFFAVLISIPAISLFGIYKIGLFEFIDAIPSEKISFINNKGLVTTTISASLGFAVMNLFPTFIQRALINKDSKQTTKAIYIKSAIYALFLVFVTINGLLAFIINPEIHASIALPYLIDHLIPHGIQGIIVVGLLAAVMSTADSDLNVTSITLVKDFLSPIFSINCQHTMLLFARIVNVMIGSIAIFISLYFTQVVDLVVFISGFWGAVVIVPLVFALFGITISKIGFICACSGGVTSFILWETYLSDSHNFKGVFIGAIVNLTIFIIIKVLFARNLLKNSG